MGLENPTYVSDLNQAWPVGNQDQKLDGDNHLRAIKTALKNTFPGFTGRIWRRRNVSASGPVTLNDNVSLIRCTQAITITPDAASVLGAWMAVIRADGGDVTINPGQPINGQDLLVVPNGYSAFLYSDGSEFFAMLVFSQLPASVKAFPTGTKMLFQQTSAPVGWTKQTSAAYNDASIRLTTGSVGTGGADAFTTVFGAGKSTAGHALTIGELPPHNHDSQVDQVGGVSSVGGGQTIVYARGFGTPFTTGNTGSGQSHTHPLNSLNLKYVDLICASID